VSLAPATGDPLGHSALIISNDPSPEKRCFPDPIYPTPKICFEDLVTFALLSGLSSEIRTIPNPASSSAKSSGGKTNQT
jgi:hypothetical protein